MNGHFNYEMAKMRIAESHRWAAQERLANEARAAQRAAAAASKPDPKPGVGFSLKRLITHLSST